MCQLISKPFFVGLVCKIFAYFIHTYMRIGKQNCVASLESGILRIPSDKSLSRLCSVQNLSPPLQA